jgi:hypothetical protein
MHEVLSALFFVHFPLIEVFVHAAAGQPSEEIEITTTKAGTAPLTICSISILDSDVDD